MCEHIQTPHTRSRYITMGDTPATPTSLSSARYRAGLECDRASGCRLEMFVEELLHRFVEVEAVLFVMKTVPFVLLYHVLDIYTAFAQAFHDLVGLGFVDPRIVRALSDKERSFDLLGMHCR